MSAAEQDRLAEERKLIVSNLVNGVGIAGVAAAFKRSPEEVQRDFDFALRKIKSYVFERCLPAFLCDNIEQAQRQRDLFLHFLDRVNLKVDPKFKKIGAHTLDEGNLKRMGLIT